MKADAKQKRRLEDANRKYKNRGVEFDYEYKEDLIKVKMISVSGYKDYMWIRKDADTHILATTINNAFTSLFRAYQSKISQGIWR